MLTDMPSCHTRGQHMVRQSHEDVHMVHRTFSPVFRHTGDPSPYYDGYQRSPYGLVGYMGICMWNTENAENTDYGQMGIAEDYLMWFSFMYGLQSDYYLVLLCSTSFYYSTHSFLSLLVPCPVWTSICILSFLPPVLVRLPTFVRLHSLSPCSCTPLPSLASDIGWTCIWSPPTRLRFPIHQTISHAVRAPLFVLTPSGLVSTCPLVFPWFNMTKRVTLAYMSPPRSASHYRPTPQSHVDSAGR